MAISGKNTLLLGACMLTAYLLFYPKGPKQPKNVKEIQRALNVFRQTILDYSLEEGNTPISIYPALQENGFFGEATFAAYQTYYKLVVGSIYGITITDDYSFLPANGNEIFEDTEKAEETRRLAGAYEQVDIAEGLSVDVNTASLDYLRVYVDSINIYDVEELYKAAMENAEG